MLETLIGVILGFLASFAYTELLKKTEYNNRKEQAIERIKRFVHHGTAEDTTHRIMDIIPTFEEPEQIEILGEIGFESSMNTNMNEITEFVVEELKWICILYESAPNLVKASKKDRRKVIEVRNNLFEMLYNIQEYSSKQKAVGRINRLLFMLKKYSELKKYDIDFKP